jgi:hypothetical protein
MQARPGSHGVERNPRGKKLGNNKTQFEKVLHKQCSMHLKSKHSIFKCISLHKSLNAPLPNQDGKRKDQEDDDEGDKSGAKEFQDPKNVVNIFFDGDSVFPLKRAQKLTLREILSIKPAI